MRIMSLLSRRSALVAFIALVGAPAALIGQGSPAVPTATLLQVEQLRDTGVAAVVYRQVPPAGPPILIVVNKNASVEAIASAMRAVYHSRKVSGETVKVAEKLVVQTAVPLAKLGAAERGAATALASRLRTAPPKLLQGYGTVRSVQVPMAPAR